MSKSSNELWQSLGGGQRGKKSNYKLSADQVLKLGWRNTRKEIEAKKIRTKRPLKGHKPQDEGALGVIYGVPR